MKIKSILKKFSFLISPARLRLRANSLAGGHFSSQKGFTQHRLYRSRKRDYLFNLYSFCKSSGAGFTLIELLIVIAILGVLAAGILVAIDPVKKLQQARDATRRTAVRQIDDAVVRYYIQYGAYPTTGCNNNWCSSQGGSSWISNLTTSREMKTVPVDPRNISSSEHVYYYQSTGSDYCIQIGLEIDIPATDPLYITNYKDISNGTQRFRFGPSGPNGGICK